MRLQCVKGVNVTSWIGEVVAGAMRPFVNRRTNLDEDHCELEEEGQAVKQEGLDEDAYIMHVSDGVEPVLGSIRQEKHRHTHGRT